MQLPEELQLAIDELVQNIPSLRKAQEDLTRNYRTAPSSTSIFKNDSQKLAYLATRMPATYSAIRHVLQRIQIPCRRLLDLGAGPGTASWAALEHFPDLEEITLIEQSHEAIALGQKLSHKWSIKAQWIQQSLETLTVFPSADLAILSYVLNETKNPEALIDHCWNSPISTLAIIEPGTPKGFALIRTLRQKLIEKGAHILAPCPHALTCPIQNADWCHFSARIERTRLHRLLKGGALGHEDEKFSYLVVSKIPQSPPPSRIVRHPQKHSGHVRLSLCTQEGTLKEKVVTRSDKNSYRQARDSEWGDQM
ncbi:MAG TPA: small ribosomal subunit Rsm22 family protein [Chlamydiales bacterium]|nr:small ribosomal subunit Rsm22 family protein [Chlamydiales bacterium]